MATKFQRAILDFINNYLKRCTCFSSKLAWVGHKMIIFLASSQRFSTFKIYILSCRVLISDRCIYTRDQRYHDKWQLIRDRGSEEDRAAWNCTLQWAWVAMPDLQRLEGQPTSTANCMQWPRLKSLCGNRSINPKIFQRWLERIKGTRGCC